MVRVRIAPSPTGIPHIGNTRTAFFNYLFAKHNNGKFIVRIEDTDRTRIVPGAEEAIYEILEWLELKWDGEPYKQSEHLDEYKKHADILLEKGSAYKDEGAIRFKMPKEGETFWDDLIGKKHILFKNETQEDFVILKSDGFPTYHLASVVDDHLMNISHVIRGDEWISSTPKHILLYVAFGWEPPIFAHLPVILGPDKTKLSKRHGALSILDYKEKGYLKEALLNFMALLGWNPGGDKEIMDIAEMIKLFDLKDINTNSPIFDIKKLRWFNAHYISKLQPQELVNRLEIKSEKLKVMSKDNLEKILSWAQSRIVTLKDFEVIASPWLEDPTWKITEVQKELSKKLLLILQSINRWDKKVIMVNLLKFCSREKINLKPLYFIFTGNDRGLPIANMLGILGKEKTLERIKKALR